MARSDARFRVAYNRLLDHCATLAVGVDLPAESALADLAGVSRTVIRRCLAGLRDEGLIAWDGREKRLLATPGEADRLAPLRTKAGGADLEHRFLDWVLRFDVPANTPLSVAELARMFDVPPHELKEFLAGLCRFGLVARRPRGGWMLLGFTRDFAVELSDFRRMLELNAIHHVVEAPVDHPVWHQLADLRAAHLALKARIDEDYHAFSTLDKRFHETLGSVVRNRFVTEFQKVISLIFHYHYLWDKSDEKRRNLAAIDEHLAILDALESRDRDAALQAAGQHLRTAKSALLSSLRAHDLA